MLLLVKWISAFYKHHLGANMINMRPLQNAPFCPIPVLGSNFNPQNTQCIPVVKIFAFLVSERNWAFFKGLNIKAGRQKSWEARWHDGLNERSLVTFELYRRLVRDRSLSGLSISSIKPWQTYSTLWFIFNQFSGKVLMNNTWNQCLIGYSFFQCFDF